MTCFFTSRRSSGAALAFAIAVLLALVCAAPVSFARPQFTAAAAPAPSSSASSKSSATAKKKKSRRHHSSRQPSQKAPTPDRISEIQSALSRDGYYQGNPNGKWDANTVAAMEKFQSAQGLDPTGKLDAKSLQKLGLGSDVAGVSAPAVPAPPSTAAPASSPHPPAQSDPQPQAQPQSQSTPQSQPAATTPQS